MRRLAAAAEAERRTPTELAEAIIHRQLSERDAAHRLITVFSAPELEAVAPGELTRSEGESDERYAARAALFAELFAIPDDT